MRKSRICSLIFILLFWTVCLDSSKAVDIPLPFAPGETIQYDIKKLKLKWGEATMTFHGLVSLEGRPELLITVTSKGLKFFDEERIYFDPQTFLPVRVERNLNIFGKKEKIIEYYNAERGTVRIVKTAKGETTEQTLKRPNALDNMYCFIFRYRMAGKFKEGEKITIHLPTRDVQFQMKEIQTLRIGEQEFRTYFMHSDPPRYRVWFAADDRRVPLRIDGAVVGKTAMIIRTYRASK